MRGNKGEEAKATKEMYETYARGDSTISIRESRFVYFLGGFPQAALIALAMTAAEKKKKSTLEPPL